MGTEDCLIRHETDDEVRAFVSDPKYTHFVGMLEPPRPGVIECITALELTHYKPDTPRNDDFHLRIINWSDIAWILVSIPTNEVCLMESTADACGLRIANGVPTMISQGEFSQFPANNERVFTLENKPGHPVYRNDPAITVALREGEREAVERIRNKGGISH
ncbi:hypothetical protein ACFL3E_00035 [Patescibacteria group bacterium]